jgi:uncharacterized coiled-coil protein SlyX
MNGDAEAAARLARVEEALAHLERHGEALGGVLHAQQRELAELRRELRRLAARLEANDGAEPPPP